MKEVTICKNVLRLINKKLTKYLRGFEGLFLQNQFE